MLADIQTLFQSDHYRVIRWKCHCDICSISKPEYNDSFCFSFMQQGYFEYGTFRRKEEVYTGRILVSKPGYPHTTRHVDKQPDISTTFEFDATIFPMLKEQYKAEAGWFFGDPDMHSLVISSDPVLEYQHFLFRQAIQPVHIGEVITSMGKAGRLEIDEQVITLLQRIMYKMGQRSAPQPMEKAARLFHLPAIEQAQHYLMQHFREDISLQQVAAHCHISPFHFSRVFKAVLHTSPHQYLLGIRLHEAQRLLMLTDHPVRDIAFDCGFNSLEYFAGAFKKHFGANPSAVRRIA